MGLLDIFPLELNMFTFDQRYDWLKMSADDAPAMSEEDFDRLKSHASALCFDTDEHQYKQDVAFSSDGFNCPFPQMLLIRQCYFSAY